MYKRNLIDYIPPFLRNIKEFNAILVDGEQPEIVMTWEALDDAMNDQFIESASESSIARWENILGIVPKATFTLDDRKFTILTKMNEKVPFTMATLNEQLKHLCGEGEYSVSLDSDNYTLNVQVALTARNNFDDVNVMLQRIVPANMIVVLTLKYNQNKAFVGYTHKSLKAFTHDYLRNGVFADGN